MSRTWFWSDLHLGHEFVAKLRGFKDDPEGKYTASAPHDVHIKKVWQKYVKEKDHVWLLGDISGGRNEEYALDFLSIMPGHKHLISGNHDSVSSIHRGSWKRQARFLEVFESVQDFARMKAHGVDFLLSHYPYNSLRSRIVPGPEWRETGIDGYHANESGQIRGRFGRVLKPWIAGYGYEYVAVPSPEGGSKQKNMTVHRMVATAFHGPPPGNGYEVAHNDGNKLNNRATNLRWALPSENQKDKILHGTNKNPLYSSKGENNPNALLTASDVSYIRESNESPAELAKSFGVSRSTIYNVKGNHSWVDNNELVSSDHVGKPDRYSEYRLSDYGIPLVHGHIHDRWDYILSSGGTPMMNVGVDHWFERPANMEDVIEWLKIEGKIK